MRYSFLILGFLVGVAHLVVAESSSLQDLPVTKVVLSSNGVGYFEQAGLVDGDAWVVLNLQTSQVNDVLKSLIVGDPQGKTVRVDYPSQDPLARTLANFALNLSSTGGLLALLPQLRGAEMTISDPEPITGRLVGWDTRLEPTDKAPQASVTVVTLATAEGLRTLALGDTMQVKLLDPKLVKDLNSALDWLAKTQNDQQKKLQIDFNGTGYRRVWLGYVSEAPVWKTTYRLDLSGPQAVLQAWAVIENTSPVDWQNVALSLVSGRPVSFIQDLYTPIYVQRPVIGASVEEPVTPQVEAQERPSASMMKRLAPAAVATQRLGDEVPLPSLEGVQTGAVFQFRLKDPVTLKRQESALLPLVQAELKAEKVDVYNQNVLEGYPLTGVWFANTSGFALPAGPVSVYDGGAWVGDSLTTTMEPGDRRVWTYAVDQQVSVIPQTATSRRITKVVLVDGVLTENDELSYVKTFQIANHSDQARTVLLEFPITRERTVVQPSNWAEKTSHLYRFRAEVAAGMTISFPVIETQTLVSRQAILGFDPQALEALVSSDQPLSSSVKKALIQAADLKLSEVRAQRNVENFQEQKQRTVSDEARLRENLAAVGRDSSQGHIYLQKLADSEKLIEGFETQIAHESLAQQAAQKKLEDYLRNLSVE